MDEAVSLEALPRRLALASVCAVLFLTFLDTTIVSVALAEVQTGLQAGVTQLQWVVNAYTLVFASLMLGAGLVGDRWGRKKVMLAGVAVFCAGSVLAALAPDVSVLIAARAVMGLGAAASEPGTLSVLRHLYPEEQTRARALGVWAGVSGLAIALGPVLGGVLIGIGGWRAVFWFNLAAGVVAGLAAARTVPESADPSRDRLDIPGVTLGVLALVAVTFGIIQGEISGFTSPLILALLLGAAAAAVAFIAVEWRRRARAPLLDLRYFRHGPFSGSVVVAFAVSFGLFSIFFFIALYLQIVKNYSGYRIAVEFLPMALVMVIGALWAGRWVARVGPGAPMAAGCALAGAGIVATRYVLTGSQPVALAATLAIAGLGIGTAVVPVTAVALGEVPAERSGMAASTANTSRVLGALFAVALLGALMNSHLTTDLKHRLRELGIPSLFQGVVVNAVEHGGVPASDPGAAKSFGPVVNQVIGAAYGAFRDGVTEALLIAGVGLLVLAPLAALLLPGRLRRRPSRVGGG